MVGRFTDHQPSIRVDHSELLVRRVGWIHRDQASSTEVIVLLDEQVPRHAEKRLCEPIGLDGVPRFQVPHEPLGVCQQVLFVHLSAMSRFSEAMLHLRRALRLVLTYPQETGLKAGASPTMGRTQSSSRFEELIGGPCPASSAHTEPKAGHAMLWAANGTCRSTVTLGFPVPAGQLDCPAPSSQLDAAEPCGRVAVGEQRMRAARQTMAGRCLPTGCTVSGLQTLSALEHSPVTGQHSSWRGATDGSRQLSRRRTERDGANRPARPVPAC